MALTSNINGIDFKIEPYVETSWYNTGGFSSLFGTGPSIPITITFAVPVSAFSIVIYDSDFNGNLVEAFDALGNVIDFKMAQYDDTPGVLTTERLTVTGNNIAYVKLTPAPGDYVWYSGLQIQGMTSVDPNLNDDIFVAGQRQIVVNIAVAAPVTSGQKYITVNIQVNPAVPAFTYDERAVSISVNTKPIPIPLTTAIGNALNDLIGNKISTYFDTTRQGKTLLNFGQDYQTLVTNWKYDYTDSSGQTILVKLYKPLASEIDTLTQLWIVREISYPYIDQIYAIFVPGEGLKLYLRPPNRNVDTTQLYGSTVGDVTLQTLSLTGSVDPFDKSDPVLQRWYTTALEGAELNVEYNDFSKFIFYSSVYRRLEAFKKKIEQIESYDTIISQQSASIAGTGTQFTSSLAYAAYERFLEQRSNLIRSFDGFEHFLYYNSGSEYSSSFTGNDDDPIYYLSEINWPKVNNVPISIASASNADLYSILTYDFDEGAISATSWWDGITDVALAYDNENRNRLSLNIPEYIIEDTRSEDFIKFIDLVGHQFDLIKPYIDKMPDIFDRSSNPAEGLSQDLVWNIASSFGVQLPNMYALKELIDYTIGRVDAAEPKVYRQYAAETWKRFLHNHIFLLKTKGTRQALQALLNIYGLLPTSLYVRESATPSYEVTGSYESFDEQTFALQFDSGSAQYIQIPWSGSTIPTINSLQLRVRPEYNISASVIANTGQFIMQALPWPSPGLTTGRIRVLNGSGQTQITSTTFDLYDGTYYTIMLQNSGSGATLYVKQADSDGNFTTNLSATELDALPGSVAYSWQASGVDKLWIGGNSLPAASGTSFIGDIDEVRVWAESTPLSAFDNFVRYPGIYYGAQPLSARNGLLVRLSFNTPTNLGTSSITYIQNESPLVDFITDQPASQSLYNVLAQFTASGFTNKSTYPYSMDIEARSVVRYTANIGGSQFVTNKVRIMEQPADRYVQDSNVPVLSNTQTIQPYEEKIQDRLSEQTIGFYFSLTDSVNDSIIRSVGNIDLHDYIGDPADMYNVQYTELTELSKVFWENYAYRYSQTQYMNYVDSLLGPMFNQAKKLKPAKSKIITGIVIEPHILERSKVQYRKIDTSGGGTFDEDENPTLYADYATTQPEDVSGEAFVQKEGIVETTDSLVQNGEYSTYETETLECNTIYELAGMYNSYNALIQAMDQYIPSGENLLYEGIVDKTAGGDDPTDLEVELPFYDEYTDLEAYKKLLLRRFNVSSVIQLSAADKIYYQQLLNTYQPSNVITVETGMNDYLDDNLVTDFDIIEPYADFRRNGTIHYFIRKTGIYPIIETSQIRYKQNILVNRGAWVAGTSYAKNDFVIQQGVSGSGDFGNGTEYVCISSDATGGSGFISKNPPALDTNNWQQMSYIYVDGIVYKKATKIDDEIEFVASNTAYTPYQGVESYHYRFRRDTLTSTKRRIWYGCKNNDDTTFDGEPPVEIVPSSGDVLYVSQGSEPIQNTGPDAGPILDVK